MTRHRRTLRWLALAAIAALTALGCVHLERLATPPGAALPGDWRALLDELRAYERRLGFSETRNFASFSKEREAFPFCGQASMRRLPYSYEDPGIRWLETAGEAHCRDVDPDTDVYYGVVEVWGEIGTPVTSAMLAGTLDRFVYLVIHEDCHDQFKLAFGIEEALCNIITYRAMAHFGAERFRWYARENRAIRDYARGQAKHTKTTIAHYTALERLYQRFEREEITPEDLRAIRARMLARAERALDLPAGELSTISLASSMTYSRHYPYLEGIADRIGPDLARVVEFFREVDSRKPAAAEVMRRYGIANQKSVEFVRANEAATLATIERILALRRAGRA
ncbi:MAG: hypothetical protein IT531_24120 [Burkholderiales bacterium]|nr:hypothetical protein [Burkholderiales bacterium]